MDQQLDFLQIHALAHKFGYVIAYSRNERIDMALKALSIMDKYKAVHPKAGEFLSLLQESDTRTGTGYTQQWLADILAAVVVPEYLYEDDITSSPDKAVLFKEFVTLCQKKFIEGDFKMLSYYITRVSSMTQFVNHCTSADRFVENRYFEYLFYQIVNVVHGLLWGQSSSQLGTPQPEINAEEKLLLIERKLTLYHGRSTYLLKSLQEYPLQIANGVETEFEFYRLTKWYLAMVKFKTGQLVSFVEEFDALYTTFSSVGLLNMQSEVLIMYSIASMACKPFKELTFASNESLMDLYTSGFGVQLSFYNVMYALAHADFTRTKSLLNDKLGNAANPVVSYMLPRDKFWQYLIDIIDLKIFLLIMSVTSKIPRLVLVRRLGYSKCTEAEYSSISDKLIVLMSVLQLGKVNIAYDEENDVFCHSPLDDTTRLMRISHQVEQIDHSSRAKAAAQLLQGILVEKYL